MPRMIAILNAAGVVVDRVIDPDETAWEAAPDKCRFDNGFDNALGRYKIAGEPGRWRLEAVPHALDVAAENSDAGKAALAPLARVVAALVAGEAPAAGDVSSLQAFLSTIDGA